MLDKVNVRNQINQQLQLVSSTMIDEYSQQLFLNMLNLIVNCKNVAMYNAYNKEISLRYIIDYALKNHIHLYQPVAFKDNRIMRLTSYGSIKKDIFSDESVVLKDNYAWYNLDMIIMPLMAVDKNGYRVGKGGGYYDATLAQYDLTNTKLCGVGYDFQYIEEDFLFDKWDTQLDYFVSPNRLIKF